ncbi:alpha/beta hydrolase [Aggregicoccus sp. 17bor-14]|uniref:alpha/beta fold hydrolase n=1 Tax=Myxococcaceae TaxID=31 RepID=UPI00129D1866|nr:MULTISPECIES: alpha/beta hydrolase [Myxococcaceae]MBF5041819.1 alpha/beta hydrolase [Simulacricoccus sp. 17bor-14]MRI87600.1 alpha/beta hydrolase [Aggregicoccus sp. 17bor-14]
MTLSVPGLPAPLASGRREGQGPLLVYLHGLGCAASSDWPPVAEAPALKGRASLWLDLPGFGLSPRPHDFGYDLREVASFLAAALSQEPVALIGHSMGGTLALLLAEELVRRGTPPEALILAEPNLRAEDAVGSKRAAAMREEDFVAQWPAWVAESEGHYRRTVEQADPVAFHRSARSLVHEGRGLIPRLASLPVAHRGYILGGRSDANTHETARQVAEAGIPVVALERSGHGFSEDDPIGFAQAIAQLLDAETSSRR